MKPDETYLGDGLYASWDGFQFYLRTSRDEGDHWCALEPQVLTEFLRFIEQKWAMTIKVIEEKKHES